MIKISLICITLVLSLIWNANAESPADVYERGQIRNQILRELGIPYTALLQQLSEKGSYPKSLDGLYQQKDKQIKVEYRQLLSGFILIGTKGLHKYSLDHKKDFREVRTEPASAVVGAINIVPLSAQRAQSGGTCPKKPLPNCKESLRKSAKDAGLPLILQDGRFVSASYGNEKALELRDAVDCGFYEQAGLRVCDLVLKIDGSAIPNDSREAMRTLTQILIKPSLLEIVRDGKRQPLQLR